MCHCLPSPQVIEVCFTELLIVHLHPGTYLASLLKHQPRHLAMAPPLVQFLAKSPDATPEHFESLEKVLFIRVHDVLLSLRPLQSFMLKLR